MTLVILLKARIFRPEGRGSETVEGKHVYRMVCKLTMTKRVFYSFTFISLRLTSRSLGDPTLLCLLHIIRVSSISIANVWLFRLFSISFYLVAALWRLMAKVARRVELTHWSDIDIYIDKFSAWSAPLRHLSRSLVTREFLFDFDLRFCLLVAFLWLACQSKIHVYDLCWVYLNIYRCIF